MEDELDFDVDLEAGGGGGGDVYEEEDYEDLYEDVNVGFFQGNNEAPVVAPAPAAAAVEAAAADESSTKQQNGKQQEQGSSSKRDPDVDESPAAAEAAAATLSPNAMPSVMISELHWWTTDADLEMALAEYGKLKSIKFLEERASGRSKGFCQADFEDAYAGQLCKENMNGRLFNGRPCVVQYATNQVVKQANIKAQTGMVNQPQTQGGTGKKPGSGANAAGGGTGSGNGRGNAGPDGSGRGGYGGKSGINSGGRGPGRGRGRGDQFGQMPMGMFDPSFGPPMRPGMFFVPRGPGYGLPFAPAHVNPAFFGPRGNGQGMVYGSPQDDEENATDFEDGSGHYKGQEPERKGRDEKGGRDHHRGDDGRGYKREKRDDSEEGYNRRRRHG